MEELPGRKEHLETFLNRHAPSKAAQQVPPREPQQADSNVPFY